MLQPRRAKRQDENQGAIVKALRDIGCIVFIIGYPFDLLVFYRGKWFVLEVKNKTHGRLTEQQENDIMALGYIDAVKIVTSAPGAVYAVMHG
jgi:hypothetical protein